MRSKSVKEALIGFWPICWRLAFLILGYVFLSPFSCEKVITFLAKYSSLFAGTTLLTKIVWNVIPTLILFLALMFVIELFISYRWFVRLICVIVGCGICLLTWNLEPAKLGLIYRFYDAFYASFTLMFLAGLLASLLYSYFRGVGAKALVLVGFVIVGSLLYEWLACLGAFNFHEERLLRPEQILVCIFGVIDKQKDIADVPSLTNGIAYGLYYFFHALLAFFGGYIIIGFVSKAAVNAMLLRFLGIPDCIFWGVNPESVVLAKSLKEQGERCVFVVSNLTSVDGGVLDQLSVDGFLWVQNGRGILRMVARLVKKHFFLSRSGSLNVEWATELAEFVKGEPDVYVVIDDEADDSWLFNWADRAEIRNALNVHIIRETSLVTNLLLSEHPMLLSPTVASKTIENEEKQTFRLILIGFGAQGRMLLNGSICDAQIPGTSFKAVIVDKRQEAFDLYAVRCPDAVSEYDLSFINMDVKKKEFFDWLGSEISTNNYSRIIVATSNDDLNLLVAEFVRNHYREEGDVSRLKDLENMLFVRVRNPENYADFNITEKKGQLHFTPFGSDKNVYSYKNVVNLNIDKVARKINAQWGGAKNEREINESWRKQPFFNRESSRASAMGIRNLWLLSGGEEHVTLSKEKLYEKWDSLMQDASLLKRLAEAEHLRWMAFHLVRGIKTWFPEEQTAIADNAIKEKRIPVKPNQIDYANCHAALIPTKKLFRMDVYLDIKSFENFKSLEEYKNFSSSFDFYAQELKKQLQSEIGASNEYPSDSDFVRNKNLLALNRCVFALRKIVPCIMSLKNLPKEMIKNLKKEVLPKFWVDVLEAYNKKESEQLDELLIKLSNDIRCEIKKINKWNLMFSSKKKEEINKILKTVNTIEAIATNTDSNKQAFRTLGNMLGNDIQIVESVPEYLLDFQSS